jgi:hypothetical protein
VLACLLAGLLDSGLLFYGGAPVQIQKMNEETNDPRDHQQLFSRRLRIWASVGYR